MGMLFGLLGPVRVLGDPADAPPGPPKQRALLTALLLSPNRVVPLDRLTTALWEGPPPRSAIANLRTYVNRLRTRIPDTDGPTRHDRIVANTPGYRIRVDHDELDSLVFADLRRKGREALRDGDLERAVSLLSSALDLWRGEAAEDIPRSPELAPRLEALDEQRWSAVEDLVHARLELGAAPELVAELRELVAQSPVRERLWKGLMLALHHTGDIAGALDAYRAAHRALDHHLGVTPGPDLERLHAALLCRDPALDPPTTVGARPVTRVAPRTPPPPTSPAAFVGRQNELLALEELLRPTDRPTLVTVHGRTGSGKSALAVRATEQLTPLYPEGRLYLDLSTAGTNPHTALRRLYGALGGTDTVEPSPERVRELAFGRRVLLLLDNAPDESWVRPLATTWPGSATLVTSGRRLSALEGGKHLALGPLHEEESVALLTALCGPARIDEHPVAVGRIAELCDHQPYPLWLAGTRLAMRTEWPLVSFARLLADPRHRLDALTCGDRSYRGALDSVYLPLRDSEHPVDRHAAELFRRLPDLRAHECGPKIAGNLMGGDTATAMAALGRLADVHLVEPVGADRYRIGGLVRAYARELSDMSVAAPLTPRRGRVSGAVG